MQSIQAALMDPISDAAGRGIGLLVNSGLKLFLKSGSSGDETESNLINRLINSVGENERPTVGRPSDTTFVWLTFSLFFFFFYFEFSSPASIFF